MLLTVEELVSVLRSSINVQIPVEETEETVTDSSYLTMTDDDIKLFIKLGVSRAYPKVTDLSELPEGSEYPIILLAKIELYLKLAVLKANDVDMGADNNNYLKQDQRFKHYMTLVEESRAEYESWLDSDGQSEVTSYDVLLSNRHYSQRNFNKQSTPKVSLKIDQVTSDSVDFQWKVTNTSHFGCFKVYISENPIVDKYKEGYTYVNKLNDGAKLVVSTQNIRNTFHRLSGLKPNTSYYVAVITVERNQIFGYDETSFKTLDTLEDEEEMSVDTI